MGGISSFFHSNDMDAYMPIAQPQVDVQRPQRRYTLSAEDVAYLHRLFSFGITPDIGLLPFQMPRMKSDTPPVARSRTTTRLKNPCNLDVQTLKLVHVKDQSYRVSFVYDASEDIHCRLFFYSHVRKNAQGCPIRFEEGVLRQDPVMYSLRKGTRLFVQPEEDGINFHNIPERNISYAHGSPITPLIVELSRIKKLNTITESPKKISRQITSARFELDPIDGHYKVHSLEQVLTTKSGGVLKLQDIYGLEQTSMCVICLNSPNTSALYPCRHLCLCAKCADEFKERSENRCPLCRCFSSDVVRVIPDQR